jgi:hypothetical protein
MKEKEGFDCRGSLKTYLFLSFGEELKVRSNKKMSF